MPVRIQNTTTASSAPMKNGMRQPQALRSASGITCCSSTTMPWAVREPAIRVTYWKLDQKPRRLRPATSDR